MPAAQPPEFRRRALDLVAQGEPVTRVAKDLGISESCLRNWMNRDAVDSGRKTGPDVLFSGFKSNLQGLVVATRKGEEGRCLDLHYSLSDCGADWLARVLDP